MNLMVTFVVAVIGWIPISSDCMINTLRNCNNPIYSDPLDSVPVILDYFQTLSSFLDHLLAPGPAPLIASCLFQ